MSMPAVPVVRPSSLDRVLSNPTRPDRAPVARLHGENGGPGLRPERQGRAQGDARRISGDQQLALDLAKPQLAPADQRREPLWTRPRTASGTASASIRSI